VPMRMPPLRERREDIPELVQHFLSQSADEGLPWKTIDGLAIERMKAYSWPGNVRELENLVRRLAALYSQESIGVEVVEAELASAGDAAPAEALASNSISEAVDRYLNDYFSQHGDQLPPAGLYERILKEVERPLISRSLGATRGNQLRAAELLGLNRNTLRKKIRELGITVSRTPK
jgi:two-component system nitrogen regulation response regulator GlnG